MKSRQLTQYGLEAKRALLEKGMTQRQLASQIGASEGYLGLIFYGERPRSKYITAINRVLGLTTGPQESQTA